MSKHGAAIFLASTRNFSGTVAVIFSLPKKTKVGAGSWSKRVVRRFPIEDRASVCTTGPDFLSDNSLSVRVRRWRPMTFSRSRWKERAPTPACRTLDVTPWWPQDTDHGLANIVSRDADPLNPLVVSVTQLHGGDTWNVLPQQAVLRGTVRALDPALQILAERRIGEIVQGQAMTFGLRANVRYERRYPPTINDPASARICATAAGALVGKENYVDLAPRPSMGSEDFAFLQQVRPRAYIWIGAGPGGWMPAAQSGIRLQ